MLMVSIKFSLASLVPLRLTSAASLAALRCAWAAPFRDLLGAITNCSDPSTPSCDLDRELRGRRRLPRDG